MAELDLEKCSFNVDELDKLEIEGDSLHDKIMQVVCLITNSKPEQLKSRRRFRNYVNARTMFSALMRKFTGYSLKRIGMLVDRDHASVMHYEKNHNDFIETDFEYKMMFTQCEALINNKLNLYDFSSQMTYIESLSNDLEHFKKKYLEYKDRYQMLNHKYQKLCRIINN